MPEDRISSFNNEIKSILILAKKWLCQDNEFSFKSSGSTGEPKNYSFSRQQIKASVDATISALQISKNDHLLLCMNPDSIGSAMLIIRALESGADLTYLNAKAEITINISIKHPFTITSLVPYQLIKSLEVDETAIGKLNGFRKILIGGAAIPFWLEKKIANLNSDCYHTYGMTETLSHIALRQIGKDKFFKPLAGVQIKLDFEECINICSEATNNEWVFTNDIAQLNTDGTFEILGRKDFVINSGAVKIHPEKVEKEIAKYLTEKLSCKLNFIISAIPDEKLGQKCVLLFEGEKDDDLASLDFKIFLPKYENPKSIYFISDFIFTPNGKIDRHKTRNLLANLINK